VCSYFFFQAEDGIRDFHVTGVQTCALPISVGAGWHACPVTEIDANIDALVPAWLTLPDIAEQLGVEVTRVRQLVKEGQLIAVRQIGRASCRERVWNAVVALAE